MKTLRRLLLWLILVPVTLIVLVQLYFFLQIGWWVHHDPESTSFMRHQLSVMQEKNPNAKLKQKWVPYNRISKNLKRAIIASEDANFSDHEGIDWSALEKAYEKNLKKGRVV
ncbi:MAG TPA: transglycosylase domain-containing protein, partial [Oxalicibacterium sp.]|nr:transglycosylase domain-containing protein [Oxalicibacterium sp.]